MYDNSKSFETEKPAEILRNLDDENLNPRVIEFAHFLSNRMNSSLVPAGFVMTTVLSLYDLEKGVDGFSGEPIENSLVGLSKKEYDELMANVPSLARTAFTDEFADEVLKTLIQTGALAPPEASDEHTLDEGEIISEPIDNIDDAYQQIVIDAKNRAIALDWKHFGVTFDEKDHEMIEKMLIPLTLRNAPFPMALNLLVNKKDQELGLLAEMMPNQKKQLRDEYYIAMMTEVISPEEAMITRDHSFLKLIETISAAKQLDVDKVMKHFMNDVDGPAWRATIRLGNVYKEIYGDEFLEQL